MGFRIETKGKPSRNGFTNTNRAGYGSFAATTLRFFSGYSSCTAVPQETMGKPNRNGFTNTNRAGYGSFSASMLRFFSWYSSCTAVPQETMGKPSRNGFTNTNRTGYGSLAAAMLRFFSCSQVVLLYHTKRWGKKAGMGLRTKPSRNGRTAFSAVCHGPVNIQATSAVECDLWYGVRRPYVALVCRCYTDLERTPKLGNYRLQIFEPPVASIFF